MDHARSRMAGMPGGQVACSVHDDSTAGGKQRQVSLWFSPGRRVAFTSASPPRGSDRRASRLLPPREAGLSAGRH